MMYTSGRYLFMADQPQRYKPDQIIKVSYAHAQVTSLGVGVVYEIRCACMATLLYSDVRIFY